MELIGRDEELRALSAALSVLRAGRSGVLVVTGEPGIGKTALLDAMAQRAADMRVVRIEGIESERDFPFAALHQLCAPLRDDIGAIPAPQHHALLTAFGERHGTAPDPFLVGLAVLSTVSEAAQRQALVLLVDDEQWLDRASRRALAFAAHRLVAESVGVVFATRSVGEELRGLPQLALGGLPDTDARALLGRSLTEPLEHQVRDRIIAEAHGNPLALVEFPRALGRSDFAGGFGAPDAPLTHSLEGVFRRQLQGLPLPTRRLLALAAADPAGDPSLLWRAAEVLGIDTAAAVPALEARLAEIGIRVIFRHPLIRSTAYRSVPLSDRQKVHAALAAVTDPDRDPDRRAWHLGHAAVGPDDTVTDELARCADRVQARGGVAAAAAFLERAATLAPDPARRCDLALSAALAKAQAGLLDAARDLLSVAESAPMNDFHRARADMVRAQLAFIDRHGSDAAPLLLSAARRLEAIDATLARETYLDAMAAAVFAGRLAVGGWLVEVAEAAEAATRGLRAPTPSDLLLDGLATQYGTSFDRGLPSVRAALRVYGRNMTAEQEIRWMLLACLAAARVWDIERHASLSIRYVQIVRDVGAVSHLPLALSSRFVPLLFTGEFDQAARVTDEMGAAIVAMGMNLSPYCAIVLAAWRGRAAELATLSGATRSDAQLRGEGHGLTVIEWADAVLANALCDYPRAQASAASASACRSDGGASWWALPELIESSSRLRDFATATAALDRLAEMTTPSGTGWGLGVEARSRALVSDGDAAEHLYREALEHLSGCGLRPDLARAHLVYGEWLRRQRRRVDARAQLRTAYELFDDIGMEAFAERARRELLATGEKARPRAGTPARVALTAQEAQIARLAREGLSNPEIGSRLFISARTVQYHLGKVFSKLGITSRSQLEHALQDP